VPADDLRGHRDDIALALRCDSDGLLNDATRAPVVVEGPINDPQNPLDKGCDWVYNIDVFKIIYLFGPRT
jgi:hypothetical protein